MKKKYLNRFEKQEIEKRYKNKELTLRNNYNKIFNKISTRTIIPMLLGVGMVFGSELYDDNHNPINFDNESSIIYQNLEDKRDMFRRLDEEYMLEHSPITIGRYFTQAEIANMKMEELAYSNPEVMEYITSKEKHDSISENSKNLGYGLFLGSLSIATGLLGVNLLKRKRDLKKLNLEKLSKLGY